MNEIIRILVLIILGLLGITQFQQKRTKDLKQEAQKAQDAAKQTEKEWVKLNEVQQKITAIAQEDPPGKVEPPERGDSASRLDRLNRLHERANARGE